MPCQRGSLISGRVIAFIEERGNGSVGAWFLIHAVPFEVLHNHCHDIVIMNDAVILSMLL